MKWHHLEGDDQTYRFLMVGEPDTKPLLFFHGYNLQPAHFLPFGRRLLEQEERSGIGQVILLNLRDHSKGRGRLFSTLDEYFLFATDFSCRFLEGEEHGYALGGHSVGGHIALWVASLFRERQPEETLLLNPAIRRSYRRQDLVRKAIQGHVEETLIARRLQSKLGGNVVALDYAFRTLCDLTPWWSCIDDIAHLELPTEPIDTPIVALLSEKDRLFQYGQSDKELLVSLSTHPDTKVSFVEGGRHNLPLRRPGLAADLIGEYFQERYRHAA